MFSLLLMTSMTINFMMMFNLHPLSIALLIIMQTIITCLLLSPILYSFWFMYIMILIFLGGMMILFIYITSLAPNEIFKTSSKMITLMLIMLIFITPYSMNQNHLTLKMDSINMNQLLHTMESPKNLMQIYSYPFSITTILTILYLLITMIVIVKITKMSKGPLRQNY